MAAPLSFNDFIGPSSSDVAVPHGLGHDASWEADKPPAQAIIKSTGQATYTRPPAKKKYKGPKNKNYRGKRATTFNVGQRGSLNFHGNRQGPVKKGRKRG
jgi:hypothetical protein